MAYGTVELNPGTGGNEVAVDSIGGNDFQRVKLALGAEGASVDAVAGAGAAGTGVQRVTLASDDPAVVALQALDNAVAGNELQVDIVTSALPSGAATAANQTTIIGHVDGIEGLLGTIDADTGNLAGILTAVQTLDNAISGNEMQVDIVAGGIVGAVHDSAVASEGIQQMLSGVAADPTAVTAADAVRAIATLLGKQVILPYALPASTWSYASPSAVTDTADDEAKAAGSGSVRHYITSAQIFNADDTVGTETVIKDGSTVLCRGWLEQTGGGAAVRFDPPLRGTAATAINVANITTSAETYFNLQGFSAAE